MRSLLLNLLLLAYHVAAAPDAILDKTNLYRSMHGAPAVSRNEKLDAIADRRAQQLSSAAELKHDASSRYGENLAMFWGEDGTVAVDMWYSEAKKYDYSYPGFSMDSGHFTQLVWRSTCRIGYSGKKSTSGATYFVMLYDPPGNVIGSFERNVFKNGTTIEGTCGSGTASPKPPPQAKAPPQPNKRTNSAVTYKPTRLLSAAIALAIYCTVAS